MVEVSYEVLQIAQISHGLICASNQWDKLIHGTVAPGTQDNNFRSPRGWVFLYFPLAKCFLLKAVGAFNRMSCRSCACARLERRAILQLSPQNI